MSLFRAVITDARPLSPTAKLYTLKSLTSDFSFIPGQYTSFTVGGSVRTYSICSSPQELPIFEFCVRQVPNGLGTRFLNEHVGKEIELTRPAGDFTLLEDASAAGVWFIAAGVGIAPVRPMLRHLLAEKPDAAVLVSYKFHNETEFLFGEELQGLTRTHENFKLEFGMPVPPPAGKSVYLVGPPGFVATTMTSLLQLGYNRQAIKTDIWE